MGVSGNKQIMKKKNRKPTKNENKHNRFVCFTRDNIINLQCNLSANGKLWKLKEKNVLCVCGRPPTVNVNYGGDGQALREIAECLFFSTIMNRIICLLVCGCQLHSCIISTTKFY